MLQLKKAEIADNDSLLSLVNSTPQKGLVTLSFERNPNYFYGSRISNQDPVVTMAFDVVTKQTIGLISNGSREVYVNGKIAKVRYGNDLRVAPCHRGKDVVTQLIKSSQRYMKGNDFSQLVIMKENIASLKSVVEGQSDVAKFMPYGKLTTYIISTAYDLNFAEKISIRNATKENIPTMQRLYTKEASRKQFYPVYDFKKIGSDSYYRGLKIEDYHLAFNGDELVGILGCWNQKSFKQTRIITYPWWLSILRPIYNIWSQVAGGLWLPTQNSLASYTNLHTAISKDNNPDIMSALLSHIRKQLARQGERTMIIGFTDSDPLRAALKGFVYRKLYSYHYLGTFSEDGLEALDQSMPVYLEVARL